VAAGEKADQTVVSFNFSEYRSLGSGVPGALGTLYSRCPKAARIFYYENTWTKYANSDFLESNGRSNHLPSWSWVGWKGEIETQLWGASSALPYNERYPLPEITIEPLVQWKALKSPDYPEHHAIPNSYAVHRSKAAPYAGWTEHQNNRATHYTHDKVPDQYFRYPVPLLEDSYTPSLAKDLCFLSLTAMRSYFEIGGILEDRFAEQERFGRDPFTFNVSILDAANRAVGALRLNLEHVNSPNRRGMQAHHNIGRYGKDRRRAT
jgi:hypothetical protein